MYARHLSRLVTEALSDSPVVLLNGARQTGKTTLAQTLSKVNRPGSYVTLDDASVLSAARSDAAGFLAGMSGPIIIDEVQHAPELFPAIKLLVDRNRTPGRFLLTGSANVLLLPQIAESLAGRMEILTLWPLAQAEIEGTSGNLVDILLAEEVAFSILSQVRAADKAEMIRRIVRGGYPEPLSRASEARRRAWFNSYLTTILQRDVRDIANIEGLTMLPRLLTILAARTSGLLNMADVSRAVGLPYATLHRYMSLLETTFLVQSLPAWTANIGRRLVRTPKVMLNDTGLVTTLLGLGEARLAAEGELFGALLENFIVMELRKLASWSEAQPQLFHFRTQTGQEVDVVLEDAAGRIAGIEVKSAATVTSGDFKGLRHLEEVSGKRFLRGLVLYTGEQVVPFAPNLYAVPISSLWQL